MMDVDTVITAAVLLAALTHACWHGLLKSGGDQLQTIAAVYGATTLVCIPLAPFVALPTATAWGCIVLSVALHCASYLTIARCYTVAHLSQAFPLYRGLAPLLVALGAWIAAGERPGPVGMAGLVLAGAGVACLAFEKGVPWRRGQVPVGLLGISAILVAAYTVVDGIGVRASTDSMGYVVWLFLLNGPVVVLVARVARRRAGAVPTGLRAGRIAAASVMALTAHGLVIWAMSVGAMAMVAALRETSVLFAALIGTLVLKEPFGRTRIAAAALVAAGVALLHGAG